MRFGSIISAMERIQHRHKTELDKDLVNVCEEIITYVKSTRKYDANGNIVKADAARIMSVSKAIDSKFGDKIAAIIRKHLNMNASVHIEANPFINAAMSVHIPNTNGAITHILARTRMQGMKDPKLTEAESNLFSLLGSAIDPTTGRLDEGARAHVEYKLFLYTGFFLSAETYDRSDIELTATECSAVILHELGHSVTITQYLGAEFYHASDLADALSLFTRSLSTASLEDLESKLDDLRALVSKEHKDMDVQIARFTNFTKGIISRIKAATANKDGIAPALAAAAPFILVSIFILIPIIYYFVRRIFSAWNSVIDAKNKGSAVTYDQRRSETLTTTRNATISERLADDFVTAHGRAGDLASAVYKMHQIDSESNATRQMLKAMGLMYTQSILWRLYTKLFPPIVPYMTPYDPLIVRFQQMVENSIVALKNPAIPKDMRDHYIKQIEDVMTTIEAAKTKVWARPQGIIIEKLLNMSSPKTLLAGLNNANLKADYEVLQNIIGGYIRNPLYLRAAILDQLNDKNKKA